MVSLYKQKNINWKSSKTSHIIIQVILFSSIILGVDNTLNTQSERTHDLSPEAPSNDEIKKTINNENSFRDPGFNITSLFDYVDSLYQTEGLFLETIDGYATSIATFEALSILRFFGLDYHKFGSDWNEKEIVIANKLTSDLLDESGSGGFLISPSASSPSLEGSFGVVNTLWIMNETKAQLKPISKDLLTFIYQTTFDKNEKGFHEIGQGSSIKATFQALTMLDLIRKTAILTPPDIHGLNKTVFDIMENSSVDIINYLDSKWVVSNSYFDSGNQYQTLIEDTWYALQSIDILERYGKLLGKSLPKSLNDYHNPVINWLKTLKKEAGVTKGGYGTSEYANVSETGIVYAILHLFNETNNNAFNNTEVISFIYSSQFLKRENRTYRTNEINHFGGFGPNNLTYHDSESSKSINLENTYYASLTLLLAGDIFNSMKINLTTSHYQDMITKYPGSINITNYIVQGRMGIIRQNFTIYNYKSHGSLELMTTIANWSLTHNDYSEKNTGFIGKTDAKYAVNLENDSQAEFNWSLGYHKVVNKISIRNLTVIRSPVYYINSTLFIGYANDIFFNTTDIKPSNNVTVTITYQNQSLLTYSNLNITNGNVSAYLISPNGTSETLFKLKPINTTSEAIKFILNVSKKALLGSWKLSLIFNQSNFIFQSTITIEVSDKVTLYQTSIINQYYPGEHMNLNVSLKYSNGFFTPNANATIIFTSNSTYEEVFTLPLEYILGNVYSINNSRCPTRFLYGFYNISVLLSWNSSIGIQTDLITNNTIDIVSIKGIPTISKAYFETNYRTDLTLEENNLFYYGEDLNLTFLIGFKSNSRINNVTDEIVIIKGGLVNVTKPSSFIQMFFVSQQNESFYLSGKINSNLPNTTYGTRFQIQSEWNNSFQYLKSSTDTKKNAAYNFILTGNFVIKEVNYMAATKKCDDLDCYALDNTSVVSVSFQVCNNELNDIPVPNLNLYGILDIKNKIGTLNRSLPSITTGIDHNGTPIYFLSLLPLDLSPNKYDITIYTWTAIKKHLKIGVLAPGFKIETTFSPSPIIQLHEAMILVAGIIFVILVYLNLKRFR